MPELPEVEAVRTGLEHLILGKTIQAVTVRWPRIVSPQEVAVFCDALRGQTFRKIDRRGKYLLFSLDTVGILSHLRMEGKYTYHPTQAEPHKHAHVLFHFTDGSELWYEDVRKFGRMNCFPLEQLYQAPNLAKLGPEPLPEVFTLAEFSQGLQKASKAIKPLLLDQKLVTGLGNIYVDESLFAAKIHPETAANALTQAEVKRLRLAIIEVLAKAVAAGGTTIRSYLNALGEAGNFQQNLNVYGQTGKPCPRCQTPIVKLKVAQRGTHICPHCQKRKGA